MTNSYVIHDGRNVLYTQSYTSLPKRVVDEAGEVHAFDRAIFDPRNFTDQKEQLVLWWVIQQVLRFEGKRQLASGTFSVKSITDSTGYHHKTIWTRLGALQARNILQYRAGKGTTKRGEVTLNLRLEQWLSPAPAVKKPRGRHAPPRQES